LAAIVPPGAATRNGSPPTSQRPPHLIERDEVSSIGMTAAQAGRHRYRRCSPCQNWQRAVARRAIALPRRFEQKVSPGRS